VSPDLYWRLLNRPPPLAMISHPGGEEGSRDAVGEICDPANTTAPWSSSTTRQTPCRPKRSPGTGLKA